MSKTNGHEIIFGYNPNPFKSFWDLLKNSQIISSRKPFGRIAGWLIILILISMPLFSMEDLHQKEFYLLLLSVALLFLFILWPIILFIVYLVLLRTSPVFYVKSLKLIKEKNGFWVTFKDGREQFIDYKNIVQMRYEPYVMSQRVGMSLSNILLYSSLLSCHFSLLFRDKLGKETKIRIPLNIAEVYRALDDIANYLPEQKRSNIRIIKGKVITFLPRKTSIAGFNIDLDTSRGQFVLVVLFLFVISIWFFMMFYLRK